MNLTDILTAHRVERCSVSNSEYSYQWWRCKGCDFESEYVPIKGVDWEALQWEVYVAHVVEAVAAAGLAIIELPEPASMYGGGKYWQFSIDGERESISYSPNDDALHISGIGAMTAADARPLAAALLAAANFAEAVPHE